MDRTWSFHLGDLPDAQTPAFNDQAWRKLDVPHDWAIEFPVDQNAPAGGAGGYFPGGIGWYRKHFTTPATWTGKTESIQFDGVYLNSQVFLNGKLLGKRSSGYASFAYDITPALAPAGQENTLAVRVDDSVQPNTRWYPGAGILRHVWLNVTNPVHIAQWGVYVATPKASADEAFVDIATDVQNDNDEEQQVALTWTILDAQGNAVTPAGRGQDAVAAKGEKHLQARLGVTQPKLWSLESPTMYRLRTTVSVGGNVVDETDTPFAIRTAVFDVNKGFLLNGQQVKIKGVCLHADGGAFGGAVPEDVWECRLTELKSMGANAVRCAHNPPAPEFLDLCDRLGILVMDEAFDEWTGRKGQLRGDYTADFNEWSQKDLETMLLRDRNHPSIILWSVGNEIPEQTSPKGVTELKALVDTCHRLDPTRAVTSACDNAYAVPRSTLPEFFALLDVAGYNYVDRWNVHRETMFDDHRREFPDRKFVGTEDTSVGGVRGDYSQPVFSGRGRGFGRGFGRGRGAPAPAPEPVATAPSDPDVPPLSPRPAYATAAIRYESLWKYFATRDFVSGDFIWTGIDYLGETGWPRKGAAAGPLDICGFPKDGYYFFQSIWLPPPGSAPNVNEKPMIHLLPHWNWKGKEGQIIPVLAYTNASTVELFLNGKSYGVKAREFPRQGTSTGWNTYAKPQVNPTTADLHLEWDIPYEPGELKAIARSDTGAVTVEKLDTTGEPAALEMIVDKNSIGDHLGGVIHAAVRITDAQGRTVPTADNVITFSTDKPDLVKLRIDNGDLSNHHLYTDLTQPAFNGWIMCYVQAADGAGGDVEIRAQSPGLQPATKTLAIKDFALPGLP
jgi:beta-galactosidase